MLESSLIVFLGIYGILIFLIIIFVLQLNLIRKSSSFDQDKLSEEIKPLLNNASMEAFKQQHILGGKDLDSKKQLIDQQLESISAQLERFKKELTDFSQGAATNSKEVQIRLDNTTEIMGELKSTTNNLNEILSSSSKRGEWGERSAKQILDLVGMQEGLHYTRQDTTKEGRPDFTFMLPNNLRVNVDSKFPLDNYAAFIKSDNDLEKSQLKKKFLSDVRNALKGLTKRDYIDPSAGTVDFAVMYIANEQVFNFVNENDLTFMDDAMKVNIIVCSPFTLYAVVSVIHKAVENFKMEKVAHDILTQMGKFDKQWDEFKTQFEKVEEALEKTTTAFSNLTTTRVNKLEVPLKEIERLREKEKSASIEN